MENKQTLTDLTGKRALVTGGTKGIGKAIADKLAEAGAKVIVTARSLPAEGTSHHFIAADLTKADQVANLAAEIKKLGGIDILINNAGGLTTPGGGFSTLTDEHWEQEMQLNLFAVTRLDRALLPAMIEQKSGVIIHMSSVAGKHPLWFLNMAYAACKSALNSYSKALSNELAAKGVRVVTVSPGASRTEGMMAVLEDYAAAMKLSVEDTIKQLMVQTGGIPMGRMSEPEEVASLVHFLVSPSAAYLTGGNYTIDGGAYPGLA
jgi:NAD(P)-dependent dehydrogenase (short-subunit alcohol dehydrogenase family)